MEALDLVLDEGFENVDRRSQMESYPTVSVVIPTHNRAHLIGRAITSVLNQTFTDWECFVVDDGSADDPETVVRSFNDSRIHFIRHPHNRGGSSARNTGIDAAAGRFIAFLDSDDEWEPTKIQKQLQKFQDSPLTNIGAMLCVQQKVYGDRIEPTIAPPRGSIMNAVLANKGLGLTASMIMLPRAVVDANIRFDEQLPAFQDWDLLAQIARQYNVERVDERLVTRHLDHDGPRVFDPCNRLPALTVILEKYADEYKTQPKHFAHQTFALAMMRFRAGDTELARKQMLAAIRLNPFNLRYSMWLVLCSLGIGKRLLPTLEVAPSTRQQAG